MGARTPPEHIPEVVPVDVNVGAGAAGIGCAVSLTRAFGLDPTRVRLLERSDAVGASFRAWPEEMRFISPSFTVHKSNCRDASPPRLNHDLHTIDATLARWRGRGGLSPCIRLTG